MYSLILLVCVFNFIYEDSDSLIVYDDSLTMAGYHSYNIKVYIRNARVTITPWSGASDSTGWLRMESPSITCHYQTVIQGTGAGYWGGSSGHGDGYGPGAGEAGGISGGGGGGAGYGGAGGDGGDYYPGSGGSTYGNASDTSLAMGSGGGAGQYSSVIDGYGGSGGAMVRIQGQAVTLDSTDIIMEGFPGEAGYVGFEGGGGGSGGGILVQGDTVYLHHTSLSARGGDGAGSEYGGGGGAGGGRIKVLYLTMMDTLGLSAAVTGGAGGTGYQGSNGAHGNSGSVHIAPLVDIAECRVPPATLSTVNGGTIIAHALTIHCEPTPALLSIYDATGKLVHTSVLTNRITTIPMDGFNNGVYFVSLHDRPARCIKIVVIK